MEDQVPIESSDYEKIEIELEVEKIMVDGMINAQQELEASHAQEIEVIESKAATVRSNLETELNALKDSSDTANKELVVLKSENDELRSKLETELRSLKDSSDNANKELVTLKSENDELRSQVKNYEQHIIQVESTLNDMRTRGQKNLQLLETKLKKYKSTRMKDKQEKQTNQLNIERQIAEKDARILSLQEELMEVSKSLDQKSEESYAVVVQKNSVIKQKDSEIQFLLGDVNEKESHLKELQSNLEAMRVHIDTKDAQIAELKGSHESLTSEHLEHKLESQRLNDVMSKEFEEYKEMYEAKHRDLESESDMFRQIAYHAQITKEGRLGKLSRSNKVFGSTWSVKHFTLVGGSLLYRDTDGRTKKGEKVFRLDQSTVIEKMESVKSGFRIRTGENSLLLQGFDDQDMYSWMHAAQSSVDTLHVKGKSLRCFPSLSSPSLLR